MSDAHVGLTTQDTGSDVTKKASDLIIDDDFQLILEAIKFGRNIYENIRKFLQYQLNISINLALYISVGSILYRDWPIQPAMILWINFIMDTFASLVLSGELPAPKNQLLLQTTPFEKSQDNLLTFDMKFNIAVQTAY